LAENAPELMNEDLRIAYAENNKTLVSDWINSHQIAEKADELLHEYTSKAYGELNKLGNLKMKLSLYTVLGKIF